MINLKFAYYYPKLVCYVLLLLWLWLKISSVDKAVKHTKIEVFNNFVKIFENNILILTAITIGFEILGLIVILIRLPKSSKKDDEIEDLKKDIELLKERL